MTSLENMIDVNTIIGDIVTTPDGAVIIPVSKVSFGFAAGGSEFNTNNVNKNQEEPKLPFGGGSGAGVNIAPMAFLVVKDSTIRLLTLNGSTPIDKLIELIPDVLNKAGCFIEKSMGKPSKSVESSDADEEYYDDDDSDSIDDTESEEDSDEK